MATIGRSFDILDQKIKQYNKSLRESQKELRTLDKDLELDPGNIDAVTKKFDTLPKILEDIKNKEEALRQKQKALNDDLEAGAISNSVYQRQLEKTNDDLAKMELQSKDVTYQLSRQNTEIRDAKFNNYINGLETVKSKTESLSRATAIATAAIVAYVYQSLQVADEIYDTAVKYQTTTEALQIQRYQYDLVTGSIDSYEAALKSVGSLQSSIASGRGAKYLYYLQQLGIAESDLEGKTQGEIYDLIFEKLRLVGDAAERSTIAVGLFGDTGNDVATMAGTTAEELQRLEDELRATGIITEEQALISGEYADKLTIIKNRLIEFALEILEAWDSLGTTGQTLLVIIVGLVIVLPKLITGIQAVSTALKVLNASGGKTILILGAVAIAILLVVNLMNKLKGQTDSTNDSINEMLENLNSTATDVQAEVSGNNTTITESNSTRNIEATVDVNVSGDTAIDSDTAVSIGTGLGDQLNADILNYELGKLVK